MTAKTRRALVLVLLGAAGSARANIEVAPSVVELMAPAGGARAQSVRVRNTSGKPLTVTSKIMDWKYEKPSGAKTFLPGGALPYSCGAWVTVFPASFRLKPGQAREVRLSVTVPRTAAGGYYSSVIFSATVPQVKKSGGVSISLAMQMATLLLLEVENTQEVKGAVTKFEARNPGPGRPLDVTARFKNKGNVRLAPKGRLAILDSRGNALGWTEFPDMKTLPGDEWEVSATWADGLSTGAYRLVGTFELAPGQVLLRERDIQIR